MELEPQPQLAIRNGQQRFPSQFSHDINECILEIVRADGVVALAAERLHISEDDLRTIIATDPNAPVLMAVHLKALLMLKTFQMVGRMDDYLVARLDELSAFETVKAHASMIKLFSELAGSQGDVSPAALPEAVLKLLAPNVREAVLGLVAKPAATS